MGTFINILILLCSVSVYAENAFYRDLNDGNKIPSVAWGSLGLVKGQNGFYRELNDGNKIPSVAMGTFGLKDPYQSVIKAVESGFRHIDTAKLYGNEEDIGRALADLIQRGVVTREEMFITSKLWNSDHDRDQVEPAIRGSLERLGLDYLDLYLIHTPMAETEDLQFLCTDYVETWRGMEDVQKLGLTRSIGVSNFNSGQINRILANCQVTPAVNELEVNPTYTNLALTSYCHENGIQVMAYGPFGFIVRRRTDRIANMRRPYFNDPYLTKLANKYGKKTGQVALRYLVDRNIIPIPRSDNITHIMDNIDILDFSLEPKEVVTISEFDINTKVYDLGNLRKHLYYSFNES